MNVKKFCSCSLQASQVTNAVLQCYTDPQAITFRAVVLSNHLQSSGEIVQSIGRWVDVGDQRIEVAGELLVVNAGCAVEIRSYSDKSCLSPSPSHSTPLSFSPSPPLPPFFSPSPSPSRSLPTTSSSSYSLLSPSPTSSLSPSPTSNFFSSLLSPSPTSNFFSSLLSPSSTLRFVSSGNRHESSSVAIDIAISIGIILGIIITVIFIIVIIVVRRTKGKRRKPQRASNVMADVLPDVYQQVGGTAMENPIYNTSTENQDSKLTSSFKKM